MSELCELYELRMSENLRKLLANVYGTIAFGQSPLPIASNVVIPWSCFVLSTPKVAFNLFVQTMSPSNNSSSRKELLVSKVVLLIRSIG